MDPQFREVDGNIGSGRFLIGRNDPNLSNEEVILAATPAVIKEGRIMGKVTRGVQAVAAPVAGAGNVGNGVFAAPPTADAGVADGAYTITVIEPAANGGELRVERPDGTQDGVAAIGAAYNGSINFTLNDGAVDFAAGDTFTVAVSYAAGSGQWKPVDPAAIDGTQVAAGILYHRAPISVGTQKNVVVARHQVVNGHLLDFGALNGNQKAVAEAQLAAQQIIVRY